MNSTTLAPMMPPTNVPAPPSTTINSASTEVVSTTFVRADDAGGVRPQHAGEAAEGAGDDEGDIFVQPGIVAEDFHARFALANADQAAAERRAHDDVQDQERNGEEAEHDVEERHRVGEIDAEFGRGAARLMPLSPPVSEFQR